MSRMMWTYLIAAVGGYAVHAEHRLEGALPGPESDQRLILAVKDVRPVGDGRGHLYLTFERVDGDWKGVGAAADYNEKSANTLTVKSLNVEESRIQAEVGVRIGKDGARRGRAHFPTPDDAFELSLDVTLGDGPAPNLPDREAFMPPWRMDTPQVVGRAVAGTYSGSWAWKKDTNTVSGTVVGGVAPLASEGQWGTEGRARLVAPSSGGIHLVADLPDRPVARYKSAWAVMRLAEPLPLEGLGALVLRVSAPKDRNDAALAVGIQTDRGKFSLRSGAVLREDAQVVTLPFERFGSSWRPFAGSEIRAVRVGAVSGDGIGRVEATVHSIAATAGPEWGPRDTPITVNVDPGTVVSLNGADEIPPGLFGFHDVGHQKPKKARDDQDDDAVAYIAKLNPGLLRPLEHTGFGGKPLSDEEVRQRMDLAGRTKDRSADTFYRRAKAGNAVERVVWTHTMDLWMRPRWMRRSMEDEVRDVRTFYRNLASRAWVPGDDTNMLRWLEVWNEPFMWGRHINMDFRLPPGAKAFSDPTQHGYIPAKVGAEAYAELFLAAAEGAKSVNPHIKIGGPSAPSFDGDDYRNFTNYVRRILDRVHGQIDFLTEHHYGGNPLSVAASYDVATAYMDRTYGRRLPIINTECNDLGASDAGKASYNLLDILHLARTCPDIAIGRSIHASWYGYLRSRGEEHAYLLLAPLRGKLLNLSFDDDQVAAVATAPGDESIVVVALQFSGATRDLRVPVPEGFEVASTTVLLADAPEKELELRDVDGAFVPKPEDGMTTLSDVVAPVNDGAVVCTLPNRSAVRHVFRRKGYAPSGSKAFRTAYLASLEALKPGAVFEAPAPVDLSGRVVLRLVAPDVHEGEGWFEAGGKRTPLPYTTCHPGGSEVVTATLFDVNVKKGEMLKIGCSDGAAYNGFRVLAASVLYEE